MLKRSKETFPFFLFYIYGKHTQNEAEKEKVDVQHIFTHKDHAPLITCFMITSQCELGGGDGNFIRLKSILPVWQTHIQAYKVAKMLVAFKPMNELLEEWLYWIRFVSMWKVFLVNFANTVFFFVSCLMRCFECGVRGNVCAVHSIMETLEYLLWHCESNLYINTFFALQMIQQDILYIRVLYANLAVR